MTPKLKWLRVLSIVAGGSCLSASPHEHSVQAPADSAFEQEMMESMSKMDQDMGAAPMTGDPNHDFSAMMIPHHQGAIDMAKTFLLHGQDAALRRLAQEIIVTQQQEIQVMQSAIGHASNWRRKRANRKETRRGRTASRFRERPRLHRRPDFEHRFGDQSGLEQVVRRHSPRRSSSRCAQSALPWAIARSRHRFLAGPSHDCSRLDRFQLGHLDRHDDKQDQRRGLHRARATRSVLHARRQGTLGGGARRRLRFGD